MPSAAASTPTTMDSCWDTRPSFTSVKYAASTASMDWEPAMAMLVYVKALERLWHTRVDSKCCAGGGGRRRGGWGGRAQRRGVA